MDLLTRYGLEFNPFLKNSKEILFKSNEFNETIVRLDYLSKAKGFGILTGAPGKGKTTAVRHWASSLNPSLFKVIYPSLSTITVNEFYKNLASSMGAQPSHRKTENFHVIQEEITRLALDKKKTPVIIIDEANYISNAILSDLKILFNFEMDSRDRAVILLVGLPQLNHTLQLAIHEPLRQRIIMNYNIDGYSKEEGRTYIFNKLKGAGCSQEVFDESAVEAILNASDGTARVISKLCCSALVIGNSQSVNTINADTVMQAINENTLE